MSDINSLLNQRLKKGAHTSKMAALAKQSAEGNLTTFSGLFSVTDLNEQEKAQLQHILKTYATNSEDITHDLNTLIAITTEVKAINNQAALLHGERIKRAHSILTRYRDGAFTAWLIATYGNRQTPYNLMQYYDFQSALPQQLRTKLEEMPRQAVYTLASRDGAFEIKKDIVKNYKGETKAELLALIRETFPLNAQDRRRENVGDGLIQSLKRIMTTLKGKRLHLTKNQREEIHNLLAAIKESVK